MADLPQGRRSPPYAHWVDSLVRRIDDERYARKFTPRRPDSKWSTSNRRRYAQLKAEGRLAPPGLDRPPTDRDGDAPKVDLERLPVEFETGLASDPAARKTYEGLPPPQKRAYVAWISHAKREATRRRRTTEALELLRAGKALGMR